MTIYNLLIAVMLSLVVYLIIRATNERYAVFITLAGTLVILFFVCSKLAAVFFYVRELGERITLSNEYFNIILKGLCICYLTEIVVGFCKDCGQSGWAEKIELACRCSLLVLAIPLFEDFLDVILKLLE